MRVSDIMSSPAITAEPSTTLDAAMALMDEHDLRHLPVVAAGRLLGVLTDRELLQATGWLPGRIREAFGDPGSRPRTVGEITRKPVMRAKPQDGVETLTVEAVVQGTGCLPVLEEGRLVGMITELDLLCAYRDACRTNGRKQSFDTSVERYMTRSVRAIDIRATLGDVRRSLRDHDVRHLPVVQGGLLVGVVSDRDVRRELGRGRRDDHPVDEIMTREPAVVGPRERLSDAVERLVHHKISSLPVVKGEELVGILTITDVLDPCMSQLREERGRGG